MRIIDKPIGENRQAAALVIFGSKMTGGHAVRNRQYDHLPSGDLRLCQEPQRGALSFLFFAEVHSGAVRAVIFRRRGLGINFRSCWRAAPRIMSRQHLYRARNLVERFFNKIKHCRRVATRYDKLAVNYLAFIQLASIRLWLRVNESTT